jgi:hypothetical protein
VTARAASPWELLVVVDGRPPDTPRHRGGGTCTDFGNGPFLGDLGAVLGVVLGVVLGSLPAGGEFCFAGNRRAERTQTTDHGRPEGRKARTKDEEIEWGNKPTT